MIRIAFAAVTALSLWTASPALADEALQLTPEQQAKVTRHITRGPTLAEPPRADVAPGVPVDGNTRTYPIPHEVAEDVPQVKPYRYFVDGPRMILVDPGTSRVVAMIDIR